MAYGGARGYSAYGHSLASEIPLPELEATGHRPDIFIIESSEPAAPEPSSRRWLLEADGSTWLVVGEGAEGTVLCFPGVADFSVDIGARRITCHLNGGSDRAAARHALLDHVVPRLLVAAGGTVLHASSVAVGGSAVLFAGRSGSGKSTLAGRCAAASHQVLADDATALQPIDGAWRAWPSYPGLRVWPESIRQLSLPVAARPVSAGAPKWRLDVPGPPDGGAAGHRVAAIVMIDRREGPTSGRRLTGSDAFARLWESAFGWPGTAIEHALFDRVTRLAEEAPVLDVRFANTVDVEEILATVDRLLVAR